MKAKVDLIYEGMSDEEFKDLIDFLERRENVSQLQFYWILDDEQKKEIFI